MKLIIQIPCYNEEHTLPSTFLGLPKKIDGISEIEVLVIDDGSSDRTVEIARDLGVDHILKNNTNRGLARTFQRGLDFCAEYGADIVVNTDGDNQYDGADIEKLIQPILDNKADLVVGNRAISSIQHFSWTKKKLQKLGSWVVRNISKTKVDDVTSGFRAYSREAILRLNVTDKYTYTLETLIQAGSSPEISVTSVDIRSNAKLRESRLMNSIFSYIQKSMQTIVRVFIMYRPMSFFGWLTLLFFVPAFFLGLRFIFNIYIFDIQDRTFIPSLVLLGMLSFFGASSLCMGIVGTLQANQREIAQQSLYLQKKRNYKNAIH